MTVAVALTLGARVFHFFSSRIIRGGPQKQNQKKKLKKKTKDESRRSFRFLLDIFLVYHWRGGGHSFFIRRELI